MAKLNDITHKIKLERAPIGSTPYLEIGDVNTSTKRITKKNKGSVAGAVIAPAKSILISKVRPTRGAVAFLTDELVVSGAFTVLTADESVCLPEFLYYQIAWNKDFHSYLGSRATGATYPTVKEKDILEYEIPILPGLDEQERMVTIFKEAEVLKHKREEADQKTIELFDALFANAFGNLDTTLLPKKLLKEATTFITDGTHLPPPFTSEGIPFLFVRNITKGFIDFNTEKFVSEESYIKLTKKYRPEKYDILYSTVGSYGIAVMVNTDNKFTFQRHIGHIRPDNKIILPEFLNAQLNTSFVRKQADLKVRGVAQKTLNLDELRKLCVVVPSLEEQRSFVERLKDLQLVQNTQSHSSVAIEELFSSLLSRSFA